jgi:hypothetical protein
MWNTVADLRSEAKPTAPAFRGLGDEEEKRQFAAQMQ